MLLAVADDEHRLVHARGLEAVEEARQEAPAPELDQALRPLVGEGGQALAQARGQDEARHGFLPFAAAPSSNWSSSCFVLSRWMRSRIAGLLDDAVELGAVVGDQAHVLDLHVVDAPAVAGLVHLVVDRDLGPALGHELRPHRRLVPVDRFLAVEDLLAAVGLDLAHVRALEEVGEELRELLALLRRRGPASAGRARACPSPASRRPRWRPRGSSGDAPRPCRAASGRGPEGWPAPGRCRS